MSASSRRFSEADSAPTLKTPSFQPGVFETLRSLSNNVCYYKASYERAHGDDYPHALPEIRLGQKTTGKRGCQTCTSHG